MSTPFTLQNPGRPIHVGVILMASTTELLDVAPIDYLHALDKKFLGSFPDAIFSQDEKAAGLTFDFHWVAVTDKAPCKLTAGVQLIPTDTFETCPPLDIVLTGANDFNYEMTEAELNFICKSWNDCSVYLAICNGQESLLKAGILAGKTATAPSDLLPILRQQHPETTWVEKRWQRDGKLWTSGTNMNGLDLMRAFMFETWGGKRDLVEKLSRMAAWPMRDVNFGDC
ncbi:hypothetical protein KVR01_006045 [Diaporthe batatas]|uniref:uncharacterized protein n=1 Tax=Diaporthe batatas TaxID=748121 RepID=UPI001D04E07F|nr:uncharacterized protein KVR01_006045 [Diaporthe batatas]KAG8164127.1 hypothetical protein KVR01_006045 [Diaporthe batatas]